jgi:metal transporter CNNM
MEKKNVVAVLNVKQLTLLDAKDSIPIRTVVEYYQNSLFYVFENTRLDYMFRAFREGNHFRSDLDYSRFEFEVQYNV